jgi:hypothetical protein
MVLALPWIKLTIMTSLASSAFSEPRLVMYHNLSGKIAVNL